MTRHDTTEEIVYTETETVTQSRDTTSKDGMLEEESFHFLLFFSSILSSCLPWLAAVKKPVPRATLCPRPLSLARFLAFSTDEPNSFRFFYYIYKEDVRLFSLNSAAANILTIRPQR